MQSETNGGFPYEAHVINLARTPEKMAAFLAANAPTGIPFQRFQAADGGAISDDEAVRMNLIKRGTRWRTRGAIGAALSHRTLWEMARSGGRPIAVFEDDACLRHDIAAVLPPLVEALGEWDIIFLGYNTDAIFEVTVAAGLNLTGQFDVRAPTAAQLKRFAAASGPVTLYRLRHTFGLAAYLVSPKGAGRLLANCFPMDNRTIEFVHARTSMPAYSIDSLMNAHFATTLTAYACVGPLALPRNDHRTSSTVAVRDRTG